MSAMMENPRTLASAIVRVLNVDAEEPSEEEVESDEVVPVEEGGTEVPGVTVEVKNPMSEVEVEAVVLTVSTTKSKSNQ